MEVNGQLHALATWPWERSLVPTEQEAGWVPDPEFEPCTIQPITYPSTDYASLAPTTYKLWS